MISMIYTMQLSLSLSIYIYICIYMYYNILQYNIGSGPQDAERSPRRGRFHWPLDVLREAQALKRERLATRGRLSPR